MVAIVVKAKPTSPGSRFLVEIKDPDLHKGKPYARLVSGKRRANGRNNTGHITVRHIGGGHKKRYRQVDFKRDKHDVPGKVERLEYDPNRSANLALVLYADGERRYIIAPEGLAVGATVSSGEKAPVAPGNALPLRSLPLGTTVHCLEMKPGKGAQLCRAAGSSAQYIASEGAYATVRLRSGETRKILLDCHAVVGRVGNEKHNLRKYGKAGAKRWRGVRPTVRGVAMNPVDHPHGGGEGKTSGGRHPVSPWGMPTKGFRTRRNKRTGKLILRRRKS